MFPRRAGRFKLTLAAAGWLVLASACGGQTAGNPSTPTTPPPSQVAAASPASSPPASPAPSSPAAAVSPAASKPAAPASAAREKMRAAYVSVSAGQVTSFAANDGGYFSKYGLDLDLSLIQ